MKIFLRAALVWLGCCSVAMAVPPVFNNYGVMVSPTNISATRFNNFGTIDFTVLTAFTNRNGAAFVALGGSLFDTYDTLYYTNANSGLMIGEPGFRFADVTPHSILPTHSFVNRGVIECLDTPVGISIYNVGTGGSGGIIVPNQNQEIPSELVINANNLLNPGTLSVGSGGKMALTARNMDLSYGVITAGQVGGTNAESLEQSLAAEDYVLAGGKLYTEDAINTFDLLWGVTNGWTGVPVAGFITSEGDGLYTATVPFPPGTTNRQGAIFGGGDVLGVNLSAFAYVYDVPQGQSTNFYYNVVLVDTNFADPNTHVSVGFGNGLRGFAWAPILPNTGSPNGIPILVTFSEDVLDPITGNTDTNAIYVEDDGGSLAPFQLAQNAAYAAAYSRPDTFEITTTPPFLFQGIGFGLGLSNVVFTNATFVPANTNFDLGEIFTSGEMSATIMLTNAVYEAQIGLNPENVQGTFEDLTGEEILAPDEPDFTNAPGRITINAYNLNLNNTKLEAEGLVTINATNVTGLPAAMNYGTADISLGALTNTLLVSNLVPVLFEQLRGNMEMWSGDWVNMQTNATSTNEIHTHLLVIVDNLTAKYTPTIRNFQTKSTNIVLHDNVQVIGSANFNTRNLTVDSIVHLTQNASDLLASATPRLQHFTVTTNGNLIVDSLLDIGFNSKRPIAVTSPVGRAYTVLSVTNQGEIVATAPTIEARTIENDGIITTLNNGSVILEGNTIGLGLDSNTVSEIFSGGEVSLSANFIEATNSTIDANQLLLWPVRELTDFVPGTLGTNGAIVNFWSVSNELELVRKPVSGDLYGTEIDVIAKFGTPSQVYWAAKDEGDTLDGFFNNATIGHLVLDRLTTNSTMQFFPTGKKNAMYVNYLELRDASFTDYHSGLFIDPRLTIYFAAANVPPNKLTAVYPNLVYASNSLSEAGASPDFVARRAMAAAGSVAQASAPVYGPAPGVYSGLFAPENGVTAQNSGYFSFTLAKNGAVSGKIFLNAAQIPFSGSLNNYGEVALTVQGLSIQFLPAASGEVLGEISGAGWNAQVSGGIATAGTAKLPATQAGSFLLRLPGASGTGPAAESYGTLTVTAQGVATAAGKLADGSSFSQSTHVSKDGQWPFFTYAPAGKDVLLGWLNFAEDSSGLSGNVTWMKPAQKGTNFPAGFNVNVQAVGTATAGPAKGGSQ